MLTFQGFATPAMLASGFTDVLGREESFTFVPPTNYLLKVWAISALKSIQKRFVIEPMRRPRIRGTIVATRPRSG
jgi:hypothetical protein